jgi:MFS family permease
MSYSIISGIAQRIGENSFEALCLRLCYNSPIIISAILGSILLVNIRKLQFFYTWIFFGLIASASSAALSPYSFKINVLVAAFMGSSLGFGMPSLLSYFKDVTTAENRGKIGGLILFTASISVVFFAVIKSMLDQTLAALFITGWRGWSLLVLPLVHEPIVKLEPKKQMTHHCIGFIYNRAFLLYLLAWFMFAFVDGFGSNIVTFYGQKFYDSLKFVEPAIVSLSALVSGIFSDIIGRKRIITFGFVSLGIAYAVLGLTPEVWLSWLLYSIISGFAIGSLWTMFTIVIWGEVAEHQIEKYYAIGEAPYFFAVIASLIFASVTTLIPKTSAFSLAALFLFLAVVPLMFAPETLPEKTLRERELKNYIEKAKRIREKFTKD